MSLDNPGLSNYHTPVWSSLSATARGILQEPDGRDYDLDRGSEDEICQAFWQAAEACVLHGLRDLRRCGIDLRVFKQSSSSFLDLFKVNMDLRSLTLDFRDLVPDDTEDPGEGVNVAMGLAHQSLLHALQLSGGWDDEPNKMDLALSHFIIPVQH